MPKPIPYFQHALDPKKGWPAPAVVDIAAKISTGVTLDPLWGGRVAHLNASGQFEAGAIGTQMPIFLIQGSQDHDVANPSPDGAQAWYGISPGGHMSGIVAISATELETTEFDPTATFNPNDLLHAPTEAQAGSGANSVAGMLFKARTWPNGDSSAIQQYRDHVCGVVSKGQIINQLRVPTLRFWPVYLPGAFGGTN